MESAMRPSAERSEHEYESAASYPDRPSGGVFGVCGTCYEPCGQLEPVENGQNGGG